MSLLLVVQPGRASREASVRVAEAVPAEAELSLGGDVVRPHDGHCLAVWQFKDEAKHNILLVTGRDLWRHRPDFVKRTDRKVITDKNIRVPVEDEGFSVRRTD